MTRNTTHPLIETGQGDPIIRLFDFFDLEHRTPWWFYLIVWLISVVVLQAPLVLYCYFNQPSLFMQVGNLELPYFYDANILVCMFLLLPLLVTHVSRERRTIGRILALLISGPASNARPNTNWGTAQWARFYARYNPISAALAGLSGIASAAILWADFTSRDLGLWQVYTPDGTELSLNAAGYYDMALVALFWGLGFWGVGRSILHMIVLKRIAKTRFIDVNPFDVDGCGGLRVVAQATHLYLPLVLATGVALVSDAVSKYVASGASLFTTRNFLMFAVYMIIGSIATVVHLLPFREALGNKKQEALKKLALARESIWYSVIEHADDKGQTSVDTTSLSRLDALGKTVNAMPEWPYDTRTIKKYLGYVLSPIVVAAIPFGIEALLEYFK